MKKLILLRGLPGSGKSTFAKSISNESTGHIESDMFFVKDGEYKFDGSKIKDAHNWCQDVVEHWMNFIDFETLSPEYSLKNIFLNTLGLMK